MRAETQLSLLASLVLEQPGTMFQLHQLTSMGLLGTHKYLLDGPLLLPLVQQSPTTPFLTQAMEVTGLLRLAR